ncbi:D-amino-acid oxidase-like [Actinia tenebrosa]|uniref:D-amino-acid oxidase-like n=1 Tax=Actinia tenebrosa TaxID=6105 RepID=A0A6P8ICC8_ACTTE|nr:D-amino-acid oxidase-like [Actinia tenebrosa]
MKSNRILVIGAGVIGATTAYELLEKGYEVILLAKQFAQGDYSVTSEVAGAQWEYPPGFCGRHNTDIKLEKPKKWAMVSYNEFKALSKNSSQTGVFWRPMYVLFQQKMEETPEQAQKLKEMSNIPTFRHSASLIKETGISTTDFVPVVDAYCVQAPAIDTVVFMKWIYNECRVKGAKFVKGEIKGKLIEQIKDLKEKYNVDLVMNCTGVAAKELAGDEKVLPLRGFVLKIKNDGVLMPKLKFSLALDYVKLLNLEDENDISNLHFYIIPRGNHSIWIGGSIEENRTDIAEADMSHELARKILDNAKAFFPHCEHSNIKMWNKLLLGYAQLERMKSVMRSTRNVQH